MARPTYNTKAWKYTRLEKLRQRPLCEHCGKPATQVDHIVPVESGGHPFDPANLQTLCQSCHSRKTAKHDDGFGNRKRRLIRGCQVDGTPNDPNHPWNKEKQKFTRAMPEDRAPGRHART